MSNETPTLPPLRLTRPFFDDAEAAALARVLASGMLVQGDEVRGFEADVVAALRACSEPALLGDGAVHAVAVNNGTTALELALLAAGVGPGDEVLVPALTWPSPGNAVVLRGAVPVLVDVEPATFNLDPRAAQAARTSRTRAALAVDQFGVPADAPALRAALPGLALIEDAACSLGSVLRGLACGLHGDLATMSFHPRKVVTTGEGGMVLTRDEALAERVRTLRNHGQRTPGSFAEAGPNARLTELQGALGRAQMAKLAVILERRATLAERLRGRVALRWQGAPEGAAVNHQTLGLALPAHPSGAPLAEARDALLAALRFEGIEAGILSYALHRLPQFRAFAVNTTRTFPVTDALVDGGLALPLHPGLTEADMDRVARALERHAGWALERGAGAR